MQIALQKRSIFPTRNEKEYPYHLSKNSKMKGFSTCIFTWNFLYKIHIVMKVNHILSIYNLTLEL